MRDVIEKRSVTWLDEWLWDLADQISRLLVSDNTFCDPGDARASNLAVDPYLMEQLKMAKKGAELKIDESQERIFLI